MQTDVGDNRPRRYVRAKTLAGLLDVHVSSVWRWVHEGRLPPPKRLSVGVTAWDWVEVEAALRREPQVQR